MSRLNSANASRSNGSTAGFGYLSGRLFNDYTPEQVTNRHAVIKQANHLASRGDWNGYQLLMSTI
jgi:hypothetical protein